MSSDLLSGVVKEMNTQRITSKNWFPVLILVILILIFFAPVFLQGRVIFPDLLNYYEPWNDYAQDLSFRFSHLKSDFVDALIPKMNLVKTGLQAGEFSLWNDVIDLGKPLIQTSLEYLLMPIYLFVWIMPTDIGFTVAIILKALFGALGMYYWLIDLKVRKSIAVPVAVVYVFSGFNLSWFLGNASIVGQFAPWAFFFINRIFKSTSPRSLWKYAVLLVLTYFFLIISGFVAGAGYVIYFSAFYVFGLFLIDLFKAIHDKNTTRWYLNLRTGVLVFLAILFAVGLGSIKLLPNLEWISFIDVGYREAYSSSSLSVENLFQILLPNYNGNPVFSNWTGGGNWNETSSYVTVALFLMSLVGIFEAIRERNKRLCLIALLALLTFLIIWGVGPFLGIVSKLPIFNSSSSTRLILLLDLFLCVLGAYGLETLLRRTSFRSVSLVLSLAAIIYGIIFFNNVRLLSDLNLNALNLYGKDVFRVLSTIPAIIFILGLSFIIFLWKKDWLSERGFVILISILLVLDIFHFSFRHIPIVPRDNFFPDTKITSYLETHQGEGRTLVLDGMFMISGSQLYYGINSVVTHNLHREPEKLLLQQFSEKPWVTPTAPMLFSKTTDFDSPILEYYGVKYLVVGSHSEIHSPDWKLVVDEPSEGKVYENLEYNDQKYWFSSNVATLETDEEFFEDIDKVAEQSLIFTDSETDLKSDLPSSEVTIELISDTNDKNVLEVCTDRSGVLTTRESYWPGWTATINDVPKPVIQANYLYRGIAIEEPGCWQIVERYQPEAFGTGKVITLVSLLALILSGIGVMILDKRAVPGTVRGNSKDEEANEGAISL